MRAAPLAAPPKAASTAVTVTSPPPQPNCYGCLRVAIGFLPGMGVNKRGYVVNIGLIGVSTNAPRFSAFATSEAALDAWARCACSGFAEQGVALSTINMSLLRTPIIVPSQSYENVPTLGPGEAADTIAQACIVELTRPATWLGARRGRCCTRSCHRWRRLR